MHPSAVHRAVTWPPITMSGATWSGQGGSSTFGIGACRTCRVSPRMSAIPRRDVRRRRTRPPLLVELVARAPGARYVVLETGHYTPIQRPELYARTVDECRDGIRA